MRPVRARVNGADQQDAQKVATSVWRNGLAELSSCRWALFGPETSDAFSGGVSSRVEGPAPTATCGGVEGLYSVRRVPLMDAAEGCTVATMRTAKGAVVVLLPRRGGEPWAAGWLEPSGARSVEVAEARAAMPMVVNAEAEAEESSVLHAATA
jgi:hypothetical protein